MSEQQKGFEGEPKNPSPEENKPRLIEDARKELARMNLENADFSDIEKLANEIGLKIELDKMSGFDIDNLAYNLEKLGKLLKLKVDKDIQDRDDF